MALFPKIQSPCPFKGDLAALMDGEVCRLCDRQVFDLTAMSDGERVSFLAGCKEEVCVSYRFPLRLAAAAIAVAAVAMPTAAAACSDETEVTTVIVGGIKDPANVQYVQAPVDKNVPELPVVYEGKDAPKDAPVTAKAPA